MERAVEIADIDRAGGDHRHGTEGSFIERTVPVFGQRQRERQL
jgi:hypothetical protein